MDLRRLILPATLHVIDLIGSIWLIASGAMEEANPVALFAMCLGGLAGLAVLKFFGMAPAMLILAGVVPVGRRAERLVYWAATSTGAAAVLALTLLVLSRL